LDKKKPTTKKKNQKNKKVWIEKRGSCQERNAKGEKKPVAETA